MTVGNSDVRYPHLVEYGTSHNSAQPFFWVALRLLKLLIQRRTKRDIRKAVRTGWDGAVIEPNTALRAALGDHCANDPAITALVDPENIRAGDFRPDELPAILFGAGNVMMHGRASGAQFVATVFMDLHIWAVEDGLDRAQTIGAAVARRLMDWPADGDIQFDAFRHTRTVWPRDPNPQFGHGVLSVEAVIRWAI